MIRNPIESIRLGVMVAVVVLTLVLLLWVFMRDRVRWWHWLMGPAVLLLAVGLDAAIETDREQLRRITKEVVAAAEDEDAEAIIARLHEDFRLGNGMDRDSVARVIQAYCSEPQIATNIFTLLEVERAEATVGTVEFKAKTFIDSQSPYAVVPVVNSHWRFEFVREEGQEYELRDMIIISIGEQGAYDIFRQRPPRR